MRNTHGAGKRPAARLGARAVRSLGLGAQRAQHGVVAGHGGPERVRSHHVAGGDAQRNMGHGKPGRVADERRDRMPGGQRLLDQMPAGSARGANDEEPHSVHSFSRSEESTTSPPKMPPAAPM